MNTSVKVVLYTSKTLSSGEHPIMLRVIKDRKSKYISIGFSCSVKLWNKKANLPKRTHSHFTEINVLISKKRLDAEKIVLQSENEDKNLSAHEIKVKLKKQKANNPFLLDYFDSIIKRFVESGQIKNSVVHKDTKRILSLFVNAKQIHFSEIDAQFLNQFEEFLKQKGLGESTIYIYLRTLRALINKAINEDFCSEKYYPFKKFSLAKYAKIKTLKRAISKSNIEKIRYLNTKNNPELIDAKNIFLFSFYCRGINFIDIAFLKWKDIENNRLNYRRSKTNELFSIELLRPAQEILKYYKHPSTNKDSFIFPILNERHKTPQSIYNRKLKMLRKINADLKEIGKLIKLETELTTYVARHSYATILKNSGVATSVISESMGHDSEKTTQIYLESFGNNILDEASKALL